MSSESRREIRKKNFTVDQTARRVEGGARRERCEVKGKAACVCVCEFFLFGTLIWPTYRHTQQLELQQTIEVLKNP